MLEVQLAKPGVHAKTVEMLARVLRYVTTRPAGHPQTAHGWEHLPESARRRPTVVSSP